MQKNRTIGKMKQMVKQNKITVQQFRTFKGQVLSGNEEGCLKGLKRLGLM